MFKFILSERVIILNTNLITIYIIPIYILFIQLVILLFIYYKGNIYI